MKPTHFQNEPCSPDTSKANINNFVNIFGLILKAKIAYHNLFNEFSYAQNAHSSENK